MELPVGSPVVPPSLATGPKTRLQLYLSPATADRIAAERDATGVPASRLVERILRDHFRTNGPIGRTSASDPRLKIPDAS